MCEAHPTASCCTSALSLLIVLPFRMLRPDPATDFLAFSLPEALATMLSALKSVVVRSSLAASRYAAGTQDLKTIAAEAHVDLIVTGTLLSTGDEIRVTAQLTDAATGTLMCSHSTQTSIGHVFRLQDELTECMVEALSLQLTSREQRILRHDVPADPKAYEHYLRGNQFSHDPKQWGAALDLYLRSVAVDPCYAPAWARLGRIHHVMAKYLTTGAGRVAMKKPYQIEAQRAVKQLEAMATDGNPAVQMMLPMAEMVGWLRKGVGELVRQAGLQLMELLMQEEVRELVGERSQRRTERTANRWGSEQGYCVVMGQKV
jgi:TolB-like protein